MPARPPGCAHSWTPPLRADGTRQHGARPSTSRLLWAGDSRCFTFARMPCRNDVVMHFLFGMGGMAPLRFRLFPVEHVSNTGPLEDRRALGLPVDLVVLHSGGLHGRGAALCLLGGLGGFGSAGYPGPGGCRQGADLCAAGLLEVGLCAAARADSEPTVCGVVARTSASSGWCRHRRHDAAWVGAAGRRSAQRGLRGQRCCAGTALAEAPAQARRSAGAARRRAQLPRRLVGGALLVSARVLVAGCRHLFSWRFLLNSAFIQCHNKLGAPSNPGCTCAAMALRLSTLMSTMRQLAAPSSTSRPPRAARPSCGHASRR